MVDGRAAVPDGDGAGLEPVLAEQLEDDRREERWVSRVMQTGCTGACSPRSRRP
jgi:hypothetical protein